MKINYKKVKNENSYIMAKCIYEFEIESSILKTHYKALTRMSMRKLFNSKRNVGFIKKEDEKKFLELVKKIENSDDEKCKTSHEKAVQKYQQKRKQNTYGECPDCAETIRFDGTHKCWESGLTY